VSLSQRPLLGVGYALICLLILGVMPILADLRPIGTDALLFTLAVTLWQLASAMPLLVIERSQRKQPTGPMAKPDSKTLLIALLTGSMFGLSTWMYVVAAEKIGPVNFIVLLQAYPLIALVLEAWLTGARKPAREWGFTVLIVAAIVYLMTEGTFQLSQVSAWSALALGVPVLWALAHVLLRPVLVKTAITPNQVTVTRLVISAVFLVLVQTAVGGSAGFASLSASQIWLAALPLGVAYYLELLFWFYAMRHIDVALGSSIMVPAPAITMLLTVFLLGGTVAAWQVGAVIIVIVGLFGLLMSTRARMKAKVDTLPVAKPR
jgi:drug/metabolite transporter (DMT)-like permease